ncbi:MAG: tetratricopeptide repeat protein [Deinococcota bacterium]
MTDDARKTPVSMPITGNKAGRDINVTGNTFNIYADPNAALTSSGVLWNLPFIRNKNFTGEAAIDTLQQMLVQHGSVAVTHQRQVVHGLGGIGKTQLALEYCYRCEDKTEGYPTYQHVWWIDAETDTSITAGLAALAVALDYKAEDAQELIQMAQAWLSQHDDWLLVFDNVENRESIEGFLPKSKHGHVLITSRASNWHGVVNADLPMQVWDEEEALAFLRKRLKRDDADYAELAEELGYLPLSLAHAASYMDSNGCSVAEYLQLYCDYRADLNEENNPLHGYDKSVQAAVLLSVDLLHKQDKQPALALLYMCAFLAPNGIPETLFGNHVEVLPEVLQKAMQSPIKAQRCWKDLLNLSLLNVQKAETEGQSSRTFTMHRVVQGVLQDDLEAQGTKQATFARCLQLLRKAFVFASGSNMATWQTAHELAENANVVVTTANDLQIMTEDLSGLCDRLGSYYQLALGEYNSAEALLRQAIEIDKTTIGENHPNYAIRLNNLALVLQATGQYKEAERLFRQAIEIDKTTIGENHPEYAIYLDNLANVLEATGQYDEAERLFRQAIEIGKTTIGENHPSYAISLNGLANVLRATGQYDEAERLFRQAHTIFLQSLGENHPHTQQLADTLTRLKSQG